MTALVHFYVLNPADPADPYSLAVPVPMGGTGLVMEHPPVVGDLVWLTGRLYDVEWPEETTAAYRVVQRAWSPARWDSLGWPLGHPAEPGPVWLDVMLTPSSGLSDPTHYRPVVPPPPSECPVCGGDWGHRDRLSPDQWERHRDDDYDTSREYGATRDGAADYAERETREAYGERPSGPIRPFGPWLDPAFVADNLDYLWRNHR